MNSLQSQSQDSLKRRWQEIRRSNSTTTVPNSSDMIITNSNGALNCCFTGLLGDDDDHLVSTLVPPVTVVLEGRSICQRISLQKHTSYTSLAKALHQMFVDAGDIGASATAVDTDTNEHIDLSNAFPGHVVAYEDMENDLLLAGDLNWKDFVRVAKRIRILPAKKNSRRGEGAR